MARFLLICPHIPEECTDALDSVLAVSHELLNRFDWGCKAGDHTGWAVVEAQNEATARMLLPTSIRAHAHAIPLNKFSAEEVNSFHAEHH